jgi:hypothetical protein
LAILAGWGRAVRGGDSSPTLKSTTLAIEDYRYVSISKKQN